MSTSAPALLPLFRSDQQLRILGVLFAEVGGEIAIGELAERAAVAQATVSREVARLEEHGLLVSRSVGRSKLVQPNWGLPWAPELRSILMQTVGVLGRLSEALGGGDGIEEAYVFGSWAARYEGQEGHFPRDVDVVVVGDASLRSVRRLCGEAAEGLRVEINPIVVARERWEAAEPEPFVAQLRGESLVVIPLGGTE